MRRRARLPPLLLPLLCLAGSAAHAAAWSDLWSTPEQQAQRLLEQHQPEAAAQRFSDPRRRAYAQLAAGHYREAADLLKPYGDPDSQYNRGNALARQGDLKDALAAYDSALQQAPNDKDIRHNRDLVARQLAQQKPQQPQQGGGQGQNPKGGQDRNGSNQGQQGQKGSQGQKTQQGQQQGQGQQGQQGQQNQQGQGQQQGQQSQGRQPGSAGGGAQQNARNGASSSSAAQAGDKAGAAAGAGQSQSSGSKDAKQAQADAAAGAQFLHDQGKSSSSAGDLAVRPGESTKAAHGDALKPPPSEQSLALDQWLQRIPEDSGELLRRKFLIEHMMRQREGEAPQ
jgi:Ca-activated chloride channel family protein